MIGALRAPRGSTCTGILKKEPLFRNSTYRLRLFLSVTQVAPDFGIGKTGTLFSSALQIVSGTNRGQERLI